jgi:hypothetical protein
MYPNKEDTDKIITAYSYQLGFDRKQQTETHDPESPLFLHALVRTRVRLSSPATMDLIRRLCPNGNGLQGWFRRIRICDESTVNLGSGSRVDYATELAIDFPIAIRFLVFAVHLLEREMEAIARY